MQKYEIIKELGNGSYGKVYLGKLKRTKELFAIKEIHLNGLENNQKEKTLIETQLLSSLKHPNIVAYKESFQEFGCLYIIMEYVDGGDLYQKIQKKKNKFFTEHEILRIFIQLCLALQYIHEKKIVHRDIKPQNVFLTNVGVVKLGDFGVARSLENTEDFCKTVIGTPFYLSPEVWSNSPYNSQTDIWSLGCILYEMCMLKKPFIGQTAQQLFAAVIRGVYEKVSSRYSQGIRFLINSMLNPTSNLRPTSTQILQIPFIINFSKNMIIDNENQLKNANLIIPNLNDNSPKKKNNNLILSPFSQNNKKISFSPKLSQNEIESLLPNEDPPNWVYKTFILPENLTNNIIEWNELKTVNDYLRKSIEKVLNEKDNIWINNIPKEDIISEEPEIIQNKILELKNKLEEKLQPMLMNMLKENILHEDSPSCSEFINIFEQNDLESVEEMRQLIKYENYLKEIS